MAAVARELKANHHMKRGVSVLAAHITGGQSVSYACHVHKGSTYWFVVGGDDHGQGLEATVTDEEGGKLSGPVTADDRDKGFVAKYVCPLDGTVRFRATDDQKEAATAVCAILTDGEGGEIGEEQWGAVFEWAELDKESEEDSGLEYVGGGWFFYGGLLNVGESFSTKVAVDAKPLTFRGIFDDESDEIKLELKDEEGKVLQSSESSVEGEDFLAAQFDWTFSSRQQPFVTLQNLKGKDSFAGVMILQETD